MEKDHRSQSIHGNQMFYSSRSLQHLFSSSSSSSSFHPLHHDQVWGLHWDLQMFCVRNLGKRSLCWLEMGVAILGN